MKNMRRDWMKVSLLCIKHGQTAATTVFSVFRKGLPSVGSSVFFSILENYHSDLTSASSCPASSQTSTKTSLQLLAKREYEFLVCTSLGRRTPSLMVVSYEEFSNNLRNLGDQIFICFLSGIKSLHFLVHCLLSEDW